MSAFDEKPADTLGRELFDDGPAACAEAGWLPTPPAWAEPAAAPDGVAALDEGPGDGGSTGLGGFAAPDEEPLAGLPSAFEAAETSSPRSGTANRTWTRVVARLQAGAAAGRRAERRARHGDPSDRSTDTGSRSR